jgi:ketosteroid isomerase-like protein
MSTAVYTTPEDAEQAFYDAFQAADLTAMMDAWADREFIECIHPLSDRAQGRDQVAASWRQIFSSGQRVRIERTGIHRTQDALLAVHVLYEHLYIPNRNEPAPPIVATNIYQLVAGSWRMVLHHASPSAFGDLEQRQETSRARGGMHRFH